MIRKILFFCLLTISTQLTLAQAPGNDCSSVVPITLALGTTMSTGMHTISNPTYTSAWNGINCAAGSTFYGGGRDGIYSINVTVPGDYAFNFANNGNTWKSLSVHSACPINPVPGPTSCIGGFGTGAARDIGTPLIMNLGIGTYYLVIDNWPPASTNPPTPGTTQNVTFELLITSPIGNDDCSGATELFSEVDCAFVTYTNANATASTGAPAPGCANYQGGDVWFTYEVNAGGEFTINTEAGVMNDSGLALYSGTCGSLALISCNDDFGGSGNMSSLTLTGRTPGEIIYIRVWDFGNTGNGTFGICVTIPIPPGDNGVYADCPNERGLELTSDFVCAPGTNSAAQVFGNLNGGPLANRLNTSVVNTTVCAFSGFNGRYEEIDFTVPTTGLYIFEMTASNFDGQGYIVVNDGLFNPGSCATGTFVVGDDDSGAGLLPRLTINLTAATNYTLVTTEWSFGGGSGNSPYTWTVTTGPNVNWLSTPPIEWYNVGVGGTPLSIGPGFSPVNFPGSGLTDTSVPGIYPFWYECSSNPGVRTQIDYVIGKYWNGSTSSNWNAASNWYGNSVPTNSQCLYIPAGTPNDPVILDDIDGDGLNLTIETGATLTLASDGNANNFGSSLTIQDNIDIQGAAGSLIVQNDASLIQVNDTPPSANSGEIQLNRNSEIRLLDYVYYSSPVQNFDVFNVYGANTPTGRIYEWIPTTATGYLGMPGNIPIIVGDWNYGTGAMNLGKGYAVRGPNGHSAGISTATATFTGVPNNGVITQALSSGNYSGGALLYNPYGADNLTATNRDDNWNLLGNPYPSAIDADTFLLANVMLEGAVHIWTHGSAIGTWADSFYDDYSSTYNPADYITYNLMGATVPFSGKIASGQGFFIMALADNESGNATFNNSMRSSAHSNTDFYRTSSENQDYSETNVLERSRIWLNIANQNGATSNTLVGYIEGATQEKDRLFDAFARELNSLNIYSKIGDERMTIQGRSLPFDENDRIPLGTVIPQAGEYSIAINDVDGIFLDDSQGIYVEDTYLEITHNLRAAPYTFTETEANDYGDRFFLRYTTDDALSINDSELSGVRIIAPKGNYIKINSDSNPIDAVTVYDLLGRTMINTNHIDKSELIINNHNLSSGAYLVKVTLSNGLSKTQKVILKQ